MTTTCDISNTNYSTCIKNNCDILFNSITSIINNTYVNKYLIDSFSDNGMLNINELDIILRDKFNEYTNNCNALTTYINNLNSDLDSEAASNSKMYNEVNTLDINIKAQQIPLISYTSKNNDNENIYKYIFLMNVLIVLIIIGLLYIIFRMSNITASETVSDAINIVSKVPSLLVNSDNLLSKSITSASDMTSNLRTNIDDVIETVDNSIIKNKNGIMLKTSYT